MLALIVRVSDDSSKTAATYDDTHLVLGSPARAPLNEATVLALLNQTCNFAPQSASLSMYFAVAAPCPTHSVRFAHRDRSSSAYGELHIVQRLGRVPLTLRIEF